MLLTDCVQQKSKSETSTRTNQQRPSALTAVHISACLVEKELLLLKLRHPALISSVVSVATETRQSAEFIPKERAVLILSRSFVASLLSASLRQCYFRVIRCKPRFYLNLGPAFSMFSAAVR